MVDGENATVKKFKFVEDKVIFYAANKNYEPQIYSANVVRVIEKAVKAEVRFK